MRTPFGTFGLIITAVAGNGTAGFSGDGGPATSASLDGPAAVALDSAGNLYIADRGNNRIRKVSGGTITTVAGGGGRLGDGGPATSGVLEDPLGVAADSAGNLYIADGDRVRKVSGGTITTVDSLDATAVAVDSAGNLYIAEYWNGLIQKVSGGTITTVAGNGVVGFSAGDGGPATSATLGPPAAVAVDSVGNLYIADTFNNRIRKVSSGTITTVAGNGNQGFFGDGGPAASASLNGPEGVAVDSSGNLYIADTGNNRVREVSGGTITTVAGNDGGYLPTGDGGPATSASLWGPSNVTVDSAGDLYITALGGIRKVSGGTITTVTGKPPEGFSGDGGAATSASLNVPGALAVDSAGNLYIADTLNYRIREVLFNPPFFGSPLAAGAVSLSLSQASGGKPVTATLTGGTTTTENSSIAVPGMAYSAQVGSASPWLSVTPQSGSTPGLITVTADPSILAPSSTPYTGTITLSVPFANPPVRTVPVQFAVGAAIPAGLSIDHTHLSFTYSSISAARTQTVTVSNAGSGPLPFSVTAAENSGQSANWLSVTPTSATATPSKPAVVSVQADPSQLPPGAYTGTVTIASAAGTAKVTVVMTISTNPVILLLSQTGLTFTAVQNGGVVAPQAFSVLNLGSGTLNWTEQTSVLGGVNNWLVATPNNGVSNAGSSNAAPAVTVSVNPAGLPPGIYYGLVTVASVGAANTPQGVVAVLQVLPAGTDVAPVVQPSSMVLTSATGTSSPSSQNVMVYDPTGTNKSFRSGIVTVNGGSWLVTLPGDATIPPTQPAPIVVQPLVNGLAAGTYQGTVTLQFSDGRVSTVAIRFIVTGGGSAPSSASQIVRGKDDSSSCAPTSLSPNLLTLGSGFSVPAGYPQGLEAQVVDNCGNPVSPQYFAEIMGIPRMPPVLDLSPVAESDPPARASGVHR